MNKLNYEMPDGYTTLQTIEQGDDQYIIHGKIGSDKSKDMLSVQKITKNSDGISVSFAECLWADISTATYIGLK